MESIGASVAAMTAAKLSLTPPPAHAAAPHATTTSHRHSAVLCYPNLSAVCAAEEAQPTHRPRQGSTSSPSTVGGYVRYLSAKWQPTNYNMRESPCPDCLPAWLPACPALTLLPCAPPLHPLNLASLLMRPLTCLFCLVPCLSFCLCFYARLPPCAQQSWSAR